MLSVDGFHVRVVCVVDIGVTVRLVGVVGGVVSGVGVGVVPVPALYMSAISVGVRARS